MIENSTTLLSIIIPSYKAGDTLHACLQSLVTQCTDAVEIIVVQSGEDGAAAQVASRFPEVRLVHWPTRLHPGAARNLGVEKSSGRLLGFTDADCIAAPNWVSTLLALTRSKHVAVGGTIGNATTTTALDWAMHFCSMHEWMPGTPSGPMNDIPTCCLAMPRSTYETYGPFRGQGYSSDTEFNWRVVRGGQLIHFDHQLRVDHGDPASWTKLLRRQPERGYHFARMRVAEEGFSLARRALYTAGSPLLPLLLIARLIRKIRAAATPAQYRRALLGALPLVTLGFTLWACGEAAGYVRGVTARN